MDGFGLVRALRERGDATPVVLLTTFDDGELLLRAAEAGAQGFLLKDASPDDLREAIPRVAARRDPAARRSPPTRCVRATPTATSPRPPTPSASARSASCACSPAAIPTRRSRAGLFLSEGTVKNYVSDILDKLGTRDRTRAVLKAITLRII